MDAFSYLSVLLSIILGLGIAHILGAVGRLIRQREQVTGYWPAWIWAGVLLLIHVQMWWSMFGLRDRAEWTFAGFGILLLQPLSLYVAAALVLPTEDADGLDLRSHYWRQARWFFGVLFSVTLISLLKEWVLEGGLPHAMNLAFHLVFLVGTALAAMLRSPRLHELNAAFAVAFFVLYVALLFSRLV